MPIARAATSRAARTAAVRLGAVALAGALLAACGSGSSDGASDSAGGKVTLTVGLFGTFGYKQAGLYDEYEKLHPNIRSRRTSPSERGLLPSRSNPPRRRQRTRGRPGRRGRQHHRGRPAQADKFVDLKKTASTSSRASSPTGSGRRPTAKDGQVVGLGTDIGPMAICYRKDLFEKAGLPTDRDRGRQAVGGRLGKYVDARQEVQEEGAARAPVHGQRRRPVQRGMICQATRAVLRQGRQADLQEQPGRQGRLGPGHRGRRRQV